MNKFNKCFLSIWLIPQIVLLRKLHNIWCLTLPAKLKKRLYPRFVQIAARTGSKSFGLFDSCEIGRQSCHSIFLKWTDYFVCVGRWINEVKIVTKVNKQNKRRGFWSRHTDELMHFLVVQAFRTPNFETQQNFEGKLRYPESYVQIPNKILLELLLV